MVRREVFERLGGLDEVLLPNGFGDIDIQARALEQGYHNFYYGTLLGTHHETKSRGWNNEDYENVALHARHAQVISSWKLRGYTVSLQSWPPAAASAVAPLTVTQAEADVPPPIAIPLRYKLADRMNVALKRTLGPFHSPLKGAVLGCRRWLRSADSGQEEAVA
jgi:hypothetical protein